MGSGPLHTRSFILSEVYPHRGYRLCTVAGKGIGMVALWVLPSLVTCCFQDSRGRLGVVSKPSQAPELGGVSLKGVRDPAPSLLSLYSRPLKFWSHTYLLLWI